MQVKHSRGIYLLRTEVGLIGNPTSIQSYLPVNVLCSKLLH